MEDYHLEHREIKVNHLKNHKNARNIHTEGINRVLRNTANMVDLKEQWPIHRAFLQHVRDVSPELISEIAGARPVEELFHTMHYAENIPLE